MFCFGPTQLHVCGEKTFEIFKSVFSFAYIPFEISNTLASCASRTDGIRQKERASEKERERERTRASERAVKSSKIYNKRSSIIKKYKKTTANKQKIDTC